MVRKIVVMISVLGISAGAASAAEKNYSADMVMRSGSETVSGKIYASGRLLRYEMGPMITITRVDRKISYVLMPDQKMYMEQPIDPMASVRAGVEEEGSVETVPMGAEEVEGRQAEKFKVVYTDSNGTSTIYQWFDGSGLPIKVEAEDGSWSVTYRNVVGGPQADELFEVPADYTSMAMPNIAALMQNMADGQDAQ